jgi:hypothetical protein
MSGISIAIRQIAGTGERLAPGIYGSGEAHPADVALEAYSLDELAETGFAAVEEHLLICDHCRVRLEGIEPVNFIHHTKDGLIYSRATKLSAGKVMARNWGTSLHGGKVLGSISAARKYLKESFWLMFPEHRCGAGCSTPEARSHKQGA